MSTKTTKEIGQEYEYFCIPFHRDTYGHKTYHWINIPEDYLEKSGYVQDFNRHRIERQRRQNGEITEYGIDGMAYDEVNDVYHILQMKCYEKNHVSANDLGTFLSVHYHRTNKKNDKSLAYLYYTSKLESNFIEDIKGTNIIPIHLPMTDNKVKSEKKSKVLPPLYKHQIDAIEALNKNYFESKDETEVDETEVNETEVDETEVNETEVNETEVNETEVDETEVDETEVDETEDKQINLLTSPCGSGKTRIVCEHLKHIQPKTILALSPLLVQVDQFKNRLEEFLPEYKFVRIDSEGTTDIQQILKDIKNNEKVCICSTFVSAKNIITQELLNHINMECVVVDEAHNLLNDYVVCQFIKCFRYPLLITATASQQLIDKLNCNIVYKYSINQAIIDNIIAKYEIIIPIPMDGKDLPLELVNLPKDLLLKGLFLINGLLKYGNRRCITYMRSIKD